MRSEQKTSVILGGIAGAAALASGSHAYAAVINGQTLNVTLPPPDGVYVAYDIDGNGTNDILFGISSTAIDTTGYGDWLTATALGAAGGSTSETVGYVGVNGFNYAFNFAAGALIGPTAPGGTSFMSIDDVSVNEPPGTNVIRLASQYTYGGTPYIFGQFPTDDTEGFVGFRFLDSDSNTHYAWIRIGITPESLRLIDAAYEGAVDTGINAGAVAVPEPGSLAALAFGAAALFRRPKK